MKNPSVTPAKNPAGTRTVRLILHGECIEKVQVEEAVAAVRGMGHQVEVCITQERGDAIAFAAEAAADGRFDTVVAGGGDGTLNEVLNGLFRKGRAPSCALGIMALGTANDFAKSVGLPVADPLAALQLAVSTEPLPIDVGRLNERLFLNVVSGGYGAEVTTATPPEMKQLLGGFAYFLTGVLNVASLAAKPTRLTGPGFEWEGDVLGLAVGNGRQAGGGFQVAPRAYLNDGMLDVLIIPGISWTDLLTLIKDLTGGPGPVGGELTVYRKLPWLEVAAPEGLQVNLDGEPVCSKTFRFDLMKDQLLCHIPPGDFLSVEREVQGTERLRQPLPPLGEGK